MADCQDQPGLYVITGGKELPLCITHDRPFKSRKVAHGLPGECPAAGQPAKMFPFPGRPDAYLSSFGLEAKTAKTTTLADLAARGMGLIGPKGHLPSDDEDRTVP